MTQGKVRVSANLKKERIWIDKHGKVLKRVGEVKQDKRESREEKKARLIKELEELE